MVSFQLENVPFNTSRTVLNAMMQCMFTDNYDSSFCFWVFKKRLTQKNCFSFVNSMVCLTVLFFNNQQIFTVLLSKLSWSAFRGDKILVFHIRSRVVSASSGSRPGHKVSGIRSKFPNLNQNGQKSHFLLGFSDSEPDQHFV